MRAFVLRDFENPPTVADIPTPEVGLGEVLVRVRGSSLNGFDLAVVSGMLKGMMEYRFPVVLGKDFSGVVEATGAGASRFAVGDPVFGVVMKPSLGDGAFGQFINVPDNYTISRTPDGLESAGVLGVAGAAALACVEATDPAPGEYVLISGANGGVGALAIQLAAARGARVIATARPGKAADFVRDLGAAYAVDWTGDLSAAVRAIHPEGVQVVFHLAGDARRLADLLVPGGRFASPLGVGPDQLGMSHVRATSIVANPDSATLDRLAAEVLSGRLRVPIQRTYAFEDLPQAMADFAAPGTLGKLAIAID